MAGRLQDDEGGFLAVIKLTKTFGGLAAVKEASFRVRKGITFGLILVITMAFMPAGITRGLSDMVRYRRSPFVNPFRKKLVE